MTRVAIIAALERELHPLVRGWRRGSCLEANGKSLPSFENEGLIAVAGGIGCRQAEAAARAVVAKYRPQMLISSGLAGALIRSLKVGSIVIPNVIVDAATRTEYRCQVGGEVVGGGVLVSVEEIAGSESKVSLAERFHALVVDMEAAGIAKVAQEFAIGFRCVKSISDEFDFAMPPLSRFVDGAGNLQSGKFAAWAGLRPQYWPAIIQLARNSGKAARSLADWLRKNLATHLPSATVVTLNGIEDVKN